MWNLAVRNYRRTAQTFLRAHLIATFALVLIFGGYLVIGSLFFDDPRASYSSFVMGCVRTPVIFLTAYFLFLLAYAMKCYRLCVFAYFLVTGSLLIWAFYSIIYIHSLK